MDIDYIDREGVVIPTHRRGRGSRWDRVLSDMPRDKVARIAVEDEEDVNRWRIGLGRAAKRHERPIRTWFADGVLYVMDVDPPA